MELRSPLSWFVFAALGLLWAAEAVALELAGGARGAVLIGRPLDVSVAGRMESPGGDSPCLEADVFQGDLRVPPPRVSARWEPAIDGRGVVRITTETAIDEPVVTVYLKVGCSSKITRRYVLLAEQPVESEARVPAVVSPQAAAAPAPVPALRQRRAKTPQRATAAQLPAATQPRRSRLKLEPLDLTPTPDPELVAAREEAARAREEAVRNAEHIRSLERDMRSLQDLTRRNVMALEMVREQMDKARSERNTMTQVALVLALLLAGIVAAWAWRSRRPAARRGWWNERRAAAESEYPSDFFAQMAATREVPAEADADIDLGFTDSTIDGAAAPIRPASSGATPRSTPSRWPGSDFAPSNVGAARLLKAEELIDIQQQAAFFQSIGDPDRAVAVLENHLQQQAEASPLVWLDLLDTYHELDRRQDYERVRAVFEEHFHTQVADFDAFGGRQDGLEGYGATLERIVQLWPSPDVLEVIEDALLRRPGAGASEALDLEAYRELVLLYNVARDLEEQEETVVAQLTRRSAETPAESAPAAAVSAQPAATPSTVPWPSPQLGLDIDLAGLPPPKTQTGAPTATAARAKSKVDEELPLLDLDSLDARSLR